MYHEYNIDIILTLSKHSESKYLYMHVIIPKAVSLNFAYIFDVGDTYTSVGAFQIRNKKYIFYNHHLTLYIIEKY